MGVMLDRDEMIRQSYALADERVDAASIRDVAPLNEQQKEELRKLGRLDGALALPLCGKTLNEAPLEGLERLWRYNWRVWKEPAWAPHLRFCKGTT